MKAIRMVAVDQPLELQDIPIPTLADHQVLVKVKAAGICHSDAHYRAGISPVDPLPLTLGHEIAGEIVETGARVSRLKPGDRVVLHYLVTCGECDYCLRGAEQYCRQGKMLGHFTDGGFAEYIAVPERNALILPQEIPFEAGATLMCASATALHALRKSRLRGGERVAIFGIGGLGLSAVQLALALGALEVYAVDVNPAKLGLASRYGARPVYVSAAVGGTSPAQQIRELSGGYGVDVALEMIGLSETMRQALLSLAVHGRAVIVGLSDQTLHIDTYRELLGPEAELIGSNDHLLSELPLLLELARRGDLDLSETVSRTIPLDAQAANQALDELEAFGSDGIRTVLVP
ncbi:MAG: alcohol dehydrogenase catalytic domain-containing protein [Anaerolineales bacterium]